MVGLTHAQKPNKRRTYYIGDNDNYGTYDLLMGFITLPTGEIVHTSTLNPNPLVQIVELSRVTVGGSTYIEQNYIYKDGTVELTTPSYTDNSINTNCIL